MRSFGKLVWNEWLKMFKKRSFFVPYAIIAAFIIFLAYMTQFMGGLQSVLTAPQFAQAVISKNGLGQFLVMLSIICTAGVVSKEFSGGTIKLLLIRSVSRSKILASKYAIVLLYSLSLTLFALIVGLVTGSVMFGFSDMAGFGNLLSATLYHAVYMAIYVTAAFMLGTLTRSSGATIGIGMTLLMLEGLVVALLSKYSFVKYLLFTNADLSVYANGRPPFEGMTMAFSLIVLAVYMFLFLGASFVTFKKRDVA
ncbi:ABC transporter permease [Paenibacillus woosongensis]|uniref:ABC transporter permease subunit n=1 Tax=Paenibacillus woosongensis TaxID=307580 RepID=A0A7X2Z0D8_9BACL|nr:ABC transporter permease [Paenibacillus woosongensis]MUG44531.1 ABC transporter permease subunit [Paenibacillus woosongensis]